ncbi:MAG: hypothetical protein COB24_07540 [Hyphomicrobiales bacterium]|nr:MAG: hypothetical protein COB24_07540 [Hyphomicrobiales bacterium]
MAKLILIPGLVSDYHIWEYAVKALAAYNPIIADVSQTTLIADIAHKYWAKMTATSMSQAIHWVASSRLKFTAKRHSG